MNIKRIAITTGAAGLILASALPVFADHSSNGISVSNRGDISSRVITLANTGNNTINSGGHEHEHSSGGSIVTGNAGASSDVLNGITTSSNCGCFTGDEHSGSLSVSNSGDIRSRVITLANTGNNTINGGGTVTSGNAGAESLVTNVIDTNVGGGSN